MGVCTSTSRLLGTHEIRERLGGISRQRAHQIITYGNFPRPIADLGQGKVWRSEDIEAWIQRHRPKSRRPGHHAG